MELEIERIQEKIIKAINYYKDYKKERPSSEDILRFVNNRYPRVDFSLFKDAMRELKLQRRICNEMRNGTFTYFIPRVPEITLKVNKPEKKEPPPKKSSALPIFPVESYRQPSTPKIVDNHREPPTVTRSVERRNGGKRVLVINSDDSYEDYEDDNDDDVGTLEKFIDKMMDRIDDVVVANEPAANILSLYEQRIFDLKSEVLFLRNLTTSNNSLLMDELRFLRNELDTKNSVIEQLTTQVAFTEYDEKRVAKAEIQYEVGYSKNSSSRLSGPENDTGKALTTGNNSKHMDEMFKRGIVEWMGNSWLNEINEIASNERNTGRHIGFSSFNILDHVKTGITPRHKGMSAHVGERSAASQLNIARMFDNFFGFTIKAPLKKLSNKIVITELENEQILRSVNGVEEVSSSRQKSIETNTNTTVQHIKEKTKKEGTRVLPDPHLNNTLRENKSTKIEIEDVEGYPGWLSLNIMDHMKSSNTKGDIRRHPSDMNLLTICENMSEKVNTINSKLRNFCDQRNINYDGKMDEPCLSLNKLPLNSNVNNLLTNAYVNRSIAT